MFKITPSYKSQNLTSPKEKEVLNPKPFVSRLAEMRLDENLIKVTVKMKPAALESP
jgi:hypothetical protein